MARGVNKAILVGTCGQDPQLRYTPNGKAVVNLSLATSEQWTDKQTGQKVEKTEWHRVVLFDKVAQIAGEYVRKGTQVYIEGKLQTREWEKDGIKRYATEIHVDLRGTLQLLGGRPQGQPAPAQQPPDNREPAQAPRPQSSLEAQAYTQRQQAAPPPPADDDYDDDLPF